MVRAKYVKQELFMSGHLSKNDDARKFKDKIFKHIFPKKFWR